MEERGKCKTQTSIIAKDLQDYQMKLEQNCPKCADYQNTKQGTTSCPETLLHSIIDQCFFYYYLYSRCILTCSP